LLIIEVKNARDVVRRRVGRLGERFIGKVFDPETQVEKALIQEIENAFEEFGIEAKILSVGGLKLDGSNSINMSVQVREERDIYIKQE
tara:strand:- start:376 stop:639 length:264 start_codon:yes stop_codon:yes gene_type:complete